MLLKEYEIFPLVIHPTKSSSVPARLCRAQFKDAWARFRPPIRTSHTGAVVSGKPAPAVVMLAKGIKAQLLARCADVRIEQPDSANGKTEPCSVGWIMASREFALGVADVRAGRPPHPDYDRWGNCNQRWNYERGRAWGLLVPKAVPLKRAGKVTDEALRWYVRPYRTSCQPALLTVGSSSREMTAARGRAQH